MVVSTLDIEINTEYQIKIIICVIRENLRLKLIYLC